MNNASTNGRNGGPTEKPQLDGERLLRWQNTYNLLRQHTKATEEQASEFADRKVAVVDQIECELALA